MKIDLTKIPTSPPEGLKKGDIKDKTDDLLEELEDLQHILYAQSKYSLLIVFQGMDASGKDGATRNVLGACNPQGVKVTSFKVPTKEELAHDFLWRVHKHTPAKGMIQVFNRSHYEDVLVVRMLGYCDDAKAKERFELINAFEKMIEHNGTKILKFYLHIGEDEQLKNLQDRLDNPKKHWKHNPGDWEMRKKWPEFRKYYQDCFEFCGPDIPWIIVPTDEKWYKEYLVAKHVVEALKSFDLKLPGLPDKDS